MMLTVQVNLSRIPENAVQIQKRTQVRVLAVVKADAYGLGAQRVARALADVVDGFCVFRLREAVDAGLKNIGKPTLALGPPDSDKTTDYLTHGVRPAVSNEAQATVLRAARPAVCADTGMQRFACPPELVDRVIRAGDCREAFTHSTKVEQALKLVEAAGGRGMTLHAAGTALLDEPRAWLDAVRPGLALYHDAVRVTAPLVEVHDMRGPVGYTGFTAARHGVILAGYSGGLRAGGPCVVNGARRTIREVGMQSSYVEIGPDDRVGDDVVLVGEDIVLADVATAWKASPQEVLMRLAGLSAKVYVE